MLAGIELVKPQEIERRSMEIISAEMGEHSFSALESVVVKRVIHATADFDFATSLFFSPGAAERALATLRRGIGIISDTKMVAAGVNKPALKRLGSSIDCFIDDPQVAELAQQPGVTRSAVSMDKAATLAAQRIFAIGNAPTALLRLLELIEQGRLQPELIIAVPVGFVNVVEAKELIVESSVPCIVARGRKGGSTVAAAICNALLYQALV